MFKKNLHCVFRFLRVRFHGAYVLKTTQIILLPVWWIADSRVFPINRKQDLKYWGWIWCSSLQSIFICYKAHTFPLVDVFEAGFSLVHVCSRKPSLSASGTLRGCQPEAKHNYHFTQVALEGNTHQTEKKETSKDTGKFFLMAFINMQHILIKWICTKGPL